MPIAIEYISSYTQKINGKLEIETEDSALKIVDRIKAFQPDVLALSITVGMPNWENKFFALQKNITRP